MDAEDVRSRVREQFAPSPSGRGALVDLDLADQAFERADGEWRRASEALHATRVEENDHPDLRSRTVTESGLRRVKEAERAEGEAWAVRDRAMKHRDQLLGQFRSTYDGLGGNW